MWATIPLDVGQHYGDVGRRPGYAGQPGLPRWFRRQDVAGLSFSHCCSMRVTLARSGSQ